MPKVQINIVLKRLLKERAMTTTDLARITKVPNSTLSTWLTPGAMPKNPEHVAAVAKALRVSMHQLLFDEPEDASVFSAARTELVLDGYYRLRLEKVIVSKD